MVGASCPLADGHRLNLELQQLLLHGRVHLLHCVAECLACKVNVIFLYEVDDKRRRRDVEFAQNPPHPELHKAVVALDAARAYVDNNIAQLPVLCDLDEGHTAAPLPPDRRVVLPGRDEVEDLVVLLNQRRRDLHRQGVARVPVVDGAVKELPKLFDVLDREFLQVLPEDHDRCQLLLNVQTCHEVVRNVQLQCS